MSEPRIQPSCRRCGSGRLGAEVMAWGVFESGELVNVDLSRPIDINQKRWALCLDCGEAQPIQVQKEDTQ